MPCDSPTCISWPVILSGARVGIVRVSPCFVWYRVNEAVGKHEERMLLTGMHTVADVVCIVCDTVVGWKYVRRGRLDS